MTRHKKNVYEMTTAFVSGFAMMLISILSFLDVPIYVICLLYLPCLIGIPLFLYLPFAYWKTKKDKLPKLSYISSVVISACFFSLLGVIMFIVAKTSGLPYDGTFYLNMFGFQVSASNSFPYFNPMTYIFAGLIYAVFNSISKNKFSDRIELPKQENKNTINTIEH